MPTQSRAKSVKAIGTSAFEDGLPAVTMNQLNFRVNRLMRSFFLPSEHREDLKQDFITEIYRALERYDPSQASATVFARRVMDRYYMYRARNLRAFLNRPDRPISLDDERDSVLNIIDEAAERPIEEIDLEGRVPAALDDLPDRFDGLVSDVQGKPISVIAEERGLSRAAAYRLVSELRAYIAASLGIAGSATAFL